MAVELTKPADEIKQMPLVELAWEILKAKKEPYYFRDLMNEIQQLRGMSEEEVSDVIARLYTEINIDGRFVCIGHNVWGLKRWYPVDKGTEKQLAGKRFVRRSGDAFSDDDEDLDEEFDDISVDDEAEEDPYDIAKKTTDDDSDDSDDDDDDDSDGDEDDLAVEDEDALFSDDDEEEEELDEEPLADGDEEDDSDEEDERF